MKKTETLDRIRKEHKEWELENFGPQDIRRPGKGVCEERGELSHAMLKFEQGIRDFDLAKYKKEGKDALADIGIYAISIANKLPSFTFRQYMDDDSLTAKLDSKPRTEQDYRDAIDTYDGEDSALGIAVAELYAAIVDFHRDGASNPPLLRMVNSSLVTLFECLVEMAQALFGECVVSLIDQTWRETVKKRNWKPKTAAV